MKHEYKLDCPECGQAHVVYDSAKDPVGKVTHCNNCFKWFAYVVNMVTVIEVYRMIKKGEDVVVEKQN